MAFAIHSKIELFVEFWSFLIMILKFSVAEWGQNLLPERLVLKCYYWFYEVSLLRTIKLRKMYHILANIKISMFWCKTNKLHVSLWTFLMRVISFWPEFTTKCVLPRDIWLRTGLEIFVFGLRCVATLGAAAYTHISTRDIVNICILEQSSSLSLLCRHNSHFHLSASFRIGKQVYRISPGCQYRFTISSSKENLVVDTRRREPVVEIHFYLGLKSSARTLMNSCPKYWKRGFTPPARPFNE